MKRLFAAVDLPHAHAASLIDQHRGLPGARWERHPHITLAHFGNVAPAEEQGVRDALAAVEFEAFEMRYAGLGAFGPPDEPSVLWVGVDCEALDELGEAVRSRLVGDRLPFKAHVTIARVSAVDSAEVTRFAQQFDTSALAPFIVDRFTLYESRDGAYHPQAAYASAPPSRPD